MRRLLDVLVSVRVVMTAIVVNASALVLNEMAGRGTPLRSLWSWIDYACVTFFLAEAAVKIERFGWSRYWASGQSEIRN